ncbi:MAG: OB-fold nucleic acid binding domain-containing protein [Euryarchaeota archaeon]|nr:OB-fold nucleic acid binding domain-containing protein [Euryarchaeota archaeon]
MEINVTSRRLTAYKVHVKELINGEFYPSEGEYEPSYLLTPFGLRVSRARILGTVVYKFLADDGNPLFIRVDDGTETIRVWCFEEKRALLEEANIGDIVDIIGRVKEREGEVYLVGELITKIEDPNWELLRELELLSLKVGKPIKKKAIKLPEKVVVPKKIEPKPTLEEIVVEESVEEGKE